MTYDVFGGTLNLAQSNPCMQRSFAISVHTVRLKMFQAWITSCTNLFWPVPN